MVWVLVLKNEFPCMHWCPENQEMSRGRDVLRFELQEGFPRLGDE